MMYDDLKKLNDLHDFEINKLHKIIEKISVENARYREALNHISDRIYLHADKTSYWKKWTHDTCAETLALIVQMARKTLKGE